MYCTAQQEATCKHKSEHVANADHIRNMSDVELAEFLEGDYGNIETGMALDWLRKFKDDSEYGRF